MANIVTQLISASLQPSSVATYRRAWKLFCEFYYTLFPASNLTFPISSSLLALFIAYLHKFQYASSTVDTYVSVLGYHQKLYGYPDPSKVFYIIQMLKGFRKNDVRIDSRLPVSLPVLHRLLDAAAQMFSHPIVFQFKAMCALAFHAFLRIGELTVSGKRSANPPLQFDQVQQIIDSSNNVVGLKISFSQFKHNYGNRPFSLLIYRKTPYCPVQLLLDYLVLRGNQPGALFLVLRFLAQSITVFFNSLQNKDNFLLVTNNICNVKLTMQLSSFSLGTLVQSVFDKHGNLVMIRSNILREIAAKSSYFSSAETCFNSNTVH